jgi:hypothetical protein
MYKASGWLSTTKMILRMQQRLRSGARHSEALSHTTARAALINRCAI